MSDKFEKKLSKRINYNSFSKKHRNTIKDAFDKNKVIDEVLDKSTIMALSKMISQGTISYVNGAIGSGKESKTYWAVDPFGKDIALKIFLVTTSNFKKRRFYIEDDPRFSHIKKGTRNLVEIWAQKEFRNLNECIKNDIPALKPIQVLKNILALEFIGHNGVPAKTLVEAEVDYDDYQNAISIISNMYKNAKLVHADFSEYNIFKTEKRLIVFDLGSAVNIKHQNAKEFLERDIKNISKFFAKRGLTVENPSDIFARITK